MIETYQHLLLNEFTARKLRRKSYSIRAFARDLDLSPSYLSLLIKGKRVLDVSRAFSICERLLWNRCQTKMFTLLVQQANARSDYERRALSDEIDEQRKCIHRFEIPLEGVLDQVRGFKEFKAKILPLLKEENILNPFLKDIVITIQHRKTPKAALSQTAAVVTCQ